MSYTASYVTPRTSLAADDLALVEAFSTHQASRAFASSTVNRRRMSLVRFAAHMAPASITSATAADIDEWMARLRSPSTKHAYRSDLSVFFRWAQRRNLVMSNPVTETDSVRRPKSLPKPASPEAITALFTVAPADLQLAIMLGALAGRAAAPAAHSDALWTGRVVLPERSRWTHPRPVLVRAHRPRRSSRGIPRFTMHAWRHYFATEAARWSGGDVVLVAALLGHEDTNTTMRYVKPHVAHGAEVVAKVSGGQVDDELAARRLKFAGSRAHEVWQ